MLIVSKPRRHHRVAGLALAVVTLVNTVPTAYALEPDGQGWFLATLRGPINDRWKLYLEAQPRVDGNGARTLLLRPALGYQVTRAWSLWQGYGWTPTFDPFRSEHRIFQQSIVETPRGALPVSLVNRTRLEERFIDGVPAPALRLRHMLRATYPLTADGTWNLAMYDEPFVNLNGRRGGPHAGFDQNRAFLGINHVFTPHVTLEMGYLNQFVNARPGQPDRMNHIALMWLDYKW